MPTDQVTVRLPGHASVQDQIRVLELELELARLKAGGNIMPGDAVPTSKGRGGQFRLLAGQHHDEDGKVYNVGMIVSCDRDLVLRFGHEKFLRVSDRAPTKGAKVVAGEASGNANEETLIIEDETTYDQSAALHNMTIAELRELAEADEIDLKGAAKKDDIIKIILAAKGHGT